jgi:hypothetical protein
MSDSMMTNCYYISTRTWKWTKKIFFQTANNFTVEKLDKCLDFISAFIARKLILSLIIQHVSLNTDEISLNPTRSLRLELRAVSGLWP